MKFGSLFSGIGGLDLGLERAGMECAWQVEIDDYCQKVLTKHWPDVPKYKDIRDVGKELGTVDLICGGFPCQDVALIGKRDGLSGQRSTLWSEFYRIVCEIRPRWVLVENVTGLFSSDNGQFFGKILRELALGRYDAEWNVVPAFSVGAPHRRERVFIVAYSQGIPGRETFESRNTLGTSRETWKNDSDLGWGEMAAFDWSLPESYYTREIDGIPRRLERDKGLGNAVVPQVAEFIGRQIMEAS